MVLARFDEIVRGAPIPRCKAWRLPGPELSFCGGVWWVGVEGMLSTIKSVLGLPRAGR